jgi:ATP-dependent DNA ligase
LLLGYYTSDGKLIYAGRAGTRTPDAELERLWYRLRSLAVPKMLLSEPAPRGSRFGSPLVLSRVHWVRPEMVVEVISNNPVAMQSPWRRWQSARQRP